MEQYNSILHYSYTTLFIAWVNIMYKYVHNKKKYEKKYGKNDKHFPGFPGGVGTL